MIIFKNFKLQLDDNGCFTVTMYMDLIIFIQSIQSFHLTRLRQPVHAMGQIVVLVQLLDSKVSTALRKMKLSHIAIKRKFNNKMTIPLDTINSHEIMKLFFSFSF